MQKNYFIRGKACEDYCAKIDYLRKNPITPLNLHDDAFSNWKIAKHPEPETKKNYNDGVLEYECS